jgi:hypothetical protein
MLTFGLVRIGNMGTGCFSMNFLGWNSVTTEAAEETEKALEGGGRSLRKYWLMSLKSGVWNAETITS